MTKEQNLHLQFSKKRDIFIVVSILVIVISIYLNNSYFIFWKHKKHEPIQDNYVEENNIVEPKDIQKFKKFLKRNSFHFDGTSLIDMSDVGKDRTDLNYIVNYNGGELEPEWAWVKNISIVYTWVDGSDIDFLDLKSKFNGGIRQVSSRDRSADELRYSLRSLIKYMPWHQGTIYIVTSQQIPKWLDTNHPRIKMIYHKDIFPPHIYPTYDSNTIELFFDKIPGITERFLYFNDDVFLNHFIHPCFFFTSGTFYPKIYRNIKRKIDVKEVERIVQSNNIHEIFQASKYYTRQAIRDYFDPDFEFRDLFHTVHVFYRDLFEPYRQLFAEELRNVYSNRFRHPTKVQTIYLYQAFMQYATQHDEFPLKLGGEGKAEDFKGFPLPTNRTIKKYSCKLVSPMIANQFIKFGRISNSSKRNNRYFHLYKTSPSIYVYNLNDAYTLRRSLYEFTGYMITRYPDPSPFEKKEYILLEKDIPSKIESLDNSINDITNVVNPAFEDSNFLEFRDLMEKNKLKIIRNYLKEKNALSQPKSKSEKKEKENKNNSVEMSTREINELRFLLSYHGEELSKEWQWAKNVSMVYILDDPYEFSNPSILKRIFSFITKIIFPPKKDSVPAKNNDQKNTYQELKYSLRSIEKYLPWYQGKIHIILPKSIPKDSSLEELSWLNLHNKRIHIISPDDIIPNNDKMNGNDQILSISSSHKVNNNHGVFLQNNQQQQSNPTFLSQKTNQPQRPIHSDRHQMEMYLDRIPGITSQFIYMRPHYYFSNYTHPRFFFSSNSSLYLNDSREHRSSIEFYPKYQFKPFDPIPTEATTVPLPLKDQNSFNYTSSLLLQYFGSNYIKTYRKLEDAPVPLYRDLFLPTRKLFMEELTALYSADSSIHKQKKIMYDILPLYLVTNFNIYGAAQPLYPKYLVGYGKIQDQRNKKEEEKDRKRRILIENKIEYEMGLNNDIFEMDGSKNHPFKDSSLFPFNHLHSNSTNTTTPTETLSTTTTTALSTFLQQPTKNFIHPFYGYDINSNTIAKYTVVTQAFKRNDSRYNYQLMRRILYSISNPSKLFFSLKWNRKDDLSPKNQYNFKKLMEYLYREKSKFERED